MKADEYLDAVGSVPEEWIKEAGEDPMPEDTYGEEDTEEKQEAYPLEEPEEHPEDKPEENHEEIKI